jgi:hypothetical protein
MLGSPKPRRLDQPVAVSLEELVPADHFYRHFEATLDLDFVRERVKDLDAERGRPSIDPVVYFKLQLVMFFEGFRSERKLVETASLHLAHRWYPGDALDESLPDHSSLTRIRCGAAARRGRAGHRDFRHIGAGRRVLPHHGSLQRASWRFVDGQSSGLVGWCASTARRRCAGN